MKPMDTMHQSFGRRNFKRPLIIAHRGYSTRFPENTLVAFEAALELDVQMIELDVRLTGDRQVVVIHDASVDRTTDGEGLVKDLPLETLKQLDAGSWFSPRFKGVRLPTLDEVLDRVNRRVLINVEIKPDTYEPGPPPDAIEMQVVDAVLRRNLLDSILISSFEPGILESIQRMEVGPALALLSRNPGKKGTLQLCHHLGAFSWHPRCGGLTKEQVVMMEEAGFKVFPYDVESSEAFRLMDQMGVDGMIMSDPTMAAN